MSNWKQPTGKQVKRRGILFVALAALMGIVVLPHAKEARSPILYVIVIGSIFVALPALVGVALISGRLGPRE